MYIEADLVIEGAVAERETFEGFDCEAKYDAWLVSRNAEAKDSGYEADVYKLFHDHSEYVDQIVDECECIQYKNDSEPDATLPYYVNIAFAEGEDDL